MPSDTNERGSDPDRLRQAQKMQLIAELTPGITHAVNNSLHSVGALSQLIHTDADLPERLREDGELLVLEADKAQRLISNLLSFVRYREPERHATPLRLLVQSVVDLTADSLAERQVDLDVDLAPDLPPIEVDRPALQQVLLTLMTMAMRSIAARPNREGRGHIGIAARLVAGATPRRVRVTVTDDAVPEGGAGGDGQHLYLDVVTEILAAHRGQLRVEAEPDGRGSMALVEIPVVAEGWDADDADGGGPAWTERTGVERAGAGVGEAAAENSSDGRRPRVLVLDDEAPIRGLLTRALERHGFDATTAADGDEALDALREAAFDVLLVDHRMPRMDGLEFERLARTIRPEISRRVVFMSGDVMDGELRAVADDAPVRVLGKPFELQAVARTVAEVVAAEGLVDR